MTDETGADWLAEALAQEPERGSLDVAGAAIDTRAWGERGQPGLLLMHGAGAHADWWSFLAPFFARDHRVAAFSFSGMGGSGWRDAYSMDLFAEEAFAVATAAGLFEAGKPAFVAHSFGGRVALRVAAGPRAEEIACAVAIDTLITPPELKGMSGRPFSERASRVYPTPEAALERFRLIPPQTGNIPALFDYVAELSIRHLVDPEQGEGWTWRFDPQIWNKLADVRSIEDLAAARCPVAAIRGARSALMIEAVTAYFDAHAPKGTPIVTVPEAHHHMMLDQPLALVAAVRGLLAGWPR